MRNMIQRKTSFPDVWKRRWKDVWIRHLKDVRFWHWKDVWIWRWKDANIGRRKDFMFWRWKDVWIWRWKDVNIGRWKDVNRTIYIDKDRARVQHYCFRLLAQEKVLTSFLPVQILAETRGYRAKYTIIPERFYKFEENQVKLIETNETQLYIFLTTFAYVWSNKFTLILFDNRTAPTNVMFIHLE